MYRITGRPKKIPNKNVAMYITVSFGIMVMKNAATIIMSKIGMNASRTSFIYIFASSFINISFLYT